MLVLSRTTGERIVIGNDIVVTVLEVGRGRIRLGIEAPPEMSIRRNELLAFPQNVGRAPVSAGEPGGNS
jgi:carbon storage regulator